MRKKDKKITEAHVRMATAPVNEHGLTTYEEDKLNLGLILSHRRRGKLREEYIEYKKKISEFSNVAFRVECNKKIWLSAYATNNLKSDYHWQCDLCYDESVRRDGADATTYTEEHSKLSEAAS